MVLYICSYTYGSMVRAFCCPPRNDDAPKEESAAEIKKREKQERHEARPKVKYGHA